MAMTDAGTVSQTHSAGSNAAAAESLSGRRRLTPPPFVTIADGHRLYVRDWGAGQPILLLAGWGMDGRCWGQTMVRLNAAGFRTVSYDRRGHGRSTDPGRLDFDLLADDLAAVLEALDLVDVVLVGHSGAAGEIIRYLARGRAGRVARAVFVGATGPRMVAASAGEPGVAPEFIDSIVESIAGDLPGWIAANIEAYAPGADAVAQRWMAGMPLDTSRRALVDFQRAILTTDLTQEARSIDLPVTLIHGDADASAPIGLTARRYAELMPQARLLVYEGAAHGLMFTHCERLAVDIRRVLADDSRP